MPKKSRMLHPAEASYQGGLTRPEQWSGWQPNEGDIIVCTPAKCGTTWTQTMILMLLHQTVELPDRVSVLSPWLDSALGDAQSNADLPASPSGRRLIKTHTPADGFAVWEHVHLVAVYRHPLDVFLSIRNHVKNMKSVDNPDLCGPMAHALDYYLNGAFDNADCDRDHLSSITAHYLRTTNRRQVGNMTQLHYTNMIEDHRGTVEKLARQLEIEHDDALIDDVTEATAFSAMKSKAVNFAPEGGKGFWHKDAAFFDSGGTHKWEGLFSEAEIEKFETRLGELLADEDQRNWLQNGY